jgi:hypothetical protein
MNFLEALVAGLQGGLDGYLTGQQFLDAQEDRKSRQQERQERAEDRRDSLAIRQAQLADEGIRSSGSVDPSERVRHPWKWEMQNRYEDIGNGYVRDRTMTKGYEADRKEADARQMVKGNLDALLGIEPGMDFGRAAGIAQASRKNPTLFNQILKDSEQGADARRLRGQLETMFPVGTSIKGVKITPELLDAAAENEDIRRNLFRDQDRVQFPPININLGDPQKQLNFTQDLGTMFARAGGQEGPPELRISHGYNAYLNSRFRKPELDAPVLEAIRAQIMGARSTKTDPFADMVKQVLEGGDTPAPVQPPSPVSPPQSLGAPQAVQPPQGQPAPYVMTPQDIAAARGMIAQIPAAQKAEVLRSQGFTDAEIAAILRR